MKKYIFIALFSITSYCSMAQVSAGAMLGYGSDVERWGLGLNAEFFINERMSLAPNLLFYFPRTEGDHKFTFWELNGNLHYYFLQDQPMNLYGLAGINVLGFKRKNTSNIIDGGDDSGSEIGLNIGLGVNFDLNGVLPFAELKYVAGDASQAVLLLGARFRISE